MPKISVLIPWRTDNAEREKLFHWNMSRWQHFLPDADFVVSDSTHGRFNRSEARNQAFKQSIGDILVIVDADTTLPDKNILDEALELVVHGKWVLPYRIYYNTSQEFTEELLKTGPAIKIPEPTTWEHRLTNAVSGVLVIPREAFLRVNGYDERFKGWGGEDRAIVMALDTLWGSSVQLDGYLLHLWHPRGEADFTQPDWPYNADLLNQYQRAMGHKGAMEDLVK